MQVQQLLYSTTYLCQLLSSLNNGLFWTEDYKNMIQLHTLTDVLYEKAVLVVGKGVLCEKCHTRGHSQQHQTTGSATSPPAGPALPPPPARHKPMHSRYPGNNLFLFFLTLLTQVPMYIFSNTSQLSYVTLGNLKFLAVLNINSAWD